MNYTIEEIIEQKEKAEKAYQNGLLTKDEYETALLFIKGLEEEE
jgi:hypothetical protein